MQIEIDFDVYKALTSKRESEMHSYNDVLRTLLDLPSAYELDKALGFAPTPSKSGRVFAGRLLPNGTELRATYKHTVYRANIRDAKLIDELGSVHGSASAAARAITNTNVNGLMFWEVKRPGDSTWKKLIALPKVSE